MRTLSCFSILAACAASAIPGCRNDEWPGPKPPPPLAAGTAPAPRSAASDAPVTPPGPEPSYAGPQVARIILTAERVGRAKQAASRNTKAWQLLLATCDAASQPEWRLSGYEAWDWANVGLDLGLCYHVTLEERFGRAAALYLKALVSDLERVGDGKADLKTVYHDNGYSIRTRGALASVLYDWMRNTKYVDRSLKKRAADQIAEWIGWYGKTTDPHGYANDKPLYNYYAGYFGAVAFFGIAFEGDDPRAGAMLQKARGEFREKIAPQFAQIGGGEWPEGWQYGPFVSLVHSAYVDADARLSQTKVDLPWLRETLPYLTHARWPDGVHMFDAGDWGSKPPVLSGRAVFGPAFVFDAKERAQASFLARNEPEPESEWHWLRVVVDDPNGGSLSPQKETSYLAKGTGTVFARTSWTKDAVWFASTNGPQFNPDHQRLDKGHFALVRGGDDIYVASAAYGSSSTLGTNALLVDDRIDKVHAGHLDYAPSQGASGVDTKVDRFEDAAHYVYARADLTDAYRPADFEWTKRRSVERMFRHYLFSRRAISADTSARLVVFDTVKVAKGSYSVTFSVHPTQVPEVSGASFIHKQRGSSARFTMLVPAGAQLNVLREPTSKSDLWHDNDHPYDGFAGRRIEVQSPKGKSDRTFLSAMTVGAAEAKHPAPTHIAAPNLDGAEIADEAYVFARGPGDLSYAVSAGVESHIVTELQPRAKYSVSVTKSGATCAVKVTAGGSRAASDAGTLAFTASGCSLK
jgi:hypothetical protein